MSYRIPIIYGNVKGRDHFPFPVTNTGPPFNTDTYPLAPGFQTVKKWIDRVKTWGLTGNLDLDFHVTDERPGPSFGNTVTGSLSSSYDLQAPILCAPPPDFTIAACASERDLLPESILGVTFDAFFDPGTLSGTSYSGSGATFTPVFGSGSFAVSADCSGEWASDPTLPPQNAFLQQVTVEVTMTLQGLHVPIGWNSTNGPAPFLNLTTFLRLLLGIPGQPPNPPNTIFEVEISASSVSADFDPTYINTEDANVFDSLNIPMYSEIFAVFAGFSGPIMGTDPRIDDRNVSPVTVVPVEFWPYSTLGGDPVWDTSSGAELNDPFS